MGIEVIDKIVAKNNGTFKLMNADKVEYNSRLLGETADTVESAINKLYEMLTAVPTIAYSEDFPSSQQFDKGMALQLKVNSTSAQGDLSFLIEKQQGSGWVTVLRETQTPGENVFDLGVISVTEQCTYRISATDGRGKAAVAESGGKYLQFECTLGSIEFTHNLDRILQRKTLQQDVWNEINLEVTAKYAIGTLGTLRITSSENIQLSQTTDDSVYFDELNISVPAGTRTITFYAKCVADAPAEEGTLSLSLSTVNNEYTSSESSYSVMFLDAGKLYIIIDGVSRTSLTTRNSLIIRYHVSSTIDTITDITFLNTKCTFTSMECSDACSHGTQWSKIKNDTRINVPLEWNIGALPHEGLWTGELSITYGDDTFSTPVTKDPLIVTPPTSSFITDDLVFSFDPKKLTDDGVWISDDESAGVYTISVSNMDGVRSGRMSEDGLDYVRFATGTYGIVKTPQRTAYNPFNTLPFINSATSDTRFTLEVSYRATCVGNLDAVALSCGTDKGASLSADFTSISGRYGLAEVGTYGADNKWIHVCYVFDSKIDRANPVPSLKIYINGVLSKYGECKFDYKRDAIFTPLCINGVSDASNVVSRTGLSDIRVLRAYDRALTAEEVVTNFISTLPEHEQAVVVQRNNTSESPVPRIYMVRQHSSRVVPSDKTPVEFSDLHTITKKEPVDDNDKDPTSKGCYVPCDIIYVDDSTKQIYEHTQVFLQGTSSLQYPVKNYQFKFYNVYEADGKKTLEKNKIIPPAKKDEWKTKSAVYTLKCDYMEQSHKNNTPTAKYYDIVRDYIVTGSATPNVDKQQVDTLKKYSPAARTLVEGSTRPGDKYRDTIDGFPILLYCLDVDNLNKTPSDIDFINTVTSNSALQYLGTFMFNVDKKGDQLGFKIDAGDLDEDLLDLTTEEKAELITGDGYKIWRYGNTSVDKTEDNFLLRTKQPIVVDNAPIIVDKVPCVSYEGAANVAVAAATFFTLEEAAALADFYNPKQVVNNDTGLATWFINNQDTNIPVQTSIDGKLNTPVRNSQSGKWEIAQYDAEGNTTIHVSSIDFMELEKPTKWSKYIKSTLEPRFTFAEDWEDEDWFNDVTYGPMRKAIEWIAQFFTFDVATYKDTLTTDSAKIEEFKRDFSKYFSYEYCMAYYLQMLFFTQIDNAGKNAMFDTWYDGVLYPRPYDMDSQMGETNTGEDKVSPAAEVHRQLSPERLKNVSCAGLSPRNTARFSEYNTSTNRLWAAFGEIYLPEIQKCYIALRTNGIYDVTNVVNFVNEMTSDVLGETFYNEDAVNKYLSLRTSGGVFNADHLPKLQGNRSIRYPNFLEQRILFLDSYFQCEKTYTKMTLRSDSAQGSNGSVNFQLSTYSPQYIRLDVGSGESSGVIYVDEQSSTGDFANKTPGVYVQCSVSGTNKEVTISGAGSIRSLGDLATANVSEIKCAEAKKIVDCKVSGAQRLTELLLGGNTYLQELDVSYCSALKGNIDVSGCSNLASLNVSNTGVETLLLPSSGCLQQLFCQDTPLTTINIENQVFLNNMTLPEGLTELNITYSSSPAILDLKPMRALRKLNIQYCSGLKFIDLENLSNLEEVSIANCPDLTEVNMKNCKYSNSVLDFSTLENLETLTLTGFTTKHSSKVCELLLAKSNTLKKLLLDNNTINRINSAQVGKFDLSGCFVQHNENYADVKLLIEGNKQVKNVDFGADLYHGNLYHVFNECSELTNLRCKFKISTQETLAALFRYCSKLKIDNNIQWVEAIAGESFNNVQNLHETFMECKQPRQALKIVNKFRYATNFYGTFYNCDTTNNPPPIGLFVYNFVKNHVNFPKNGRPMLTCTFGQCNFRTFEGMTAAEIEEAIREDELAQDLTPEEIAQGHITNGWWLHEHVFSPWKNNDIRSGGMYLTFTGCNVEKISGNLFKDLTMHVNSTDDGTTYSFRSTFSGCPRLTEITSPLIIPKGDWNAGFLNCKHMFENCPKLKTIVRGDASGPLIDFTACKKTLSSTHKMFANCTSLELSVSDLHGIFNSCTSLQNASAMFANCYNIYGELPSNFSLNEHKDTSCSVTDVSGMFANCVKLGGVVPDTFFANCPRITTVGGTHVTSNAVTRSFGGVFSNTNIKGVSSNLLTDLHNLRDCSMLFFQEKRSTDTGLPLSATNKGLQDLTVNLDEKIGLEFFPTNFTIPASVKNVDFMLAGNTRLSKFTDDEGTAVLEPTFCLPDSVQTASGIFCGCNNSQETFVTALNTVATQLFNNKDSLQNADFAFADSAITTIDSKNLFKGCNIPSSHSLTLQGMFMNSHLADPNLNASPDVLSTDIFAPISNVLVSTRDMFANCTSLNCSLGRAAVNQNTSASINFHMIHDGADVFAVPYCEDTFVSDGTELTISYAESSEVLFIHGSTEYSAVSVSSGRLKLQEGITLEGEPFLCKKGDLETETFSWKLSSGKYITVECGAFGAVHVATTSDVVTLTQDNKFIINYFWVDSASDSQQGLFYNCTRLEDISGMFANCTALHGGIPEDMFNSPVDFVALRYMQSLFAHCYRLTQSSYNNTTRVYNPHYMYTRSINAKDDNYLVPADWLARCVNVTDISEMFKYCGNHIVSTTADAPSASTLRQLGRIDDSMFNYSSKITSAKNTFRYCIDIQHSTITRALLNSSLGVLEDVSEMFKGAAIKSLGLQASTAPFVPSNGKNTILKRADHCFVRVEYLRREGNTTQIEAADSNYGPTSAQLQNISPSSAGERLYDITTGQFLTNWAKISEEGKFVTSDGATSEYGQEPIRSPYNIVTISYNPVYT